MSRATIWSPKRKEVRDALRPFARPSYWLALTLVALDLCLYALGSLTVVLAPGIGGKVVASLVIALAISRMFVLGHDACHNSLTPSRRLNKWLGRALFLPTMSCASLWIAGHNVAHHGFPGLRGRDIPWVPLSPLQYSALPRGKRWRYRIFRSWWGAGIYYGLDVWWRQQYFPKGKVRPEFIRDSWLVTVFMGAQIAAYAWAAHATAQSIGAVLLLGIVVPFVVWLYLAAIVFYVHHTDETARWFDDENEWRVAQPNLEGTHGTHLPMRIDLVLHHALEHTAHHVNAAIPCYRLADAQRVLQARWPAEVPTRIITLRRYFATTKACQLYDGKLHRWVTFAEADAAAQGLAPARPLHNLASGEPT